MKQCNLNLIAVNLIAYNGFFLRYITVELHTTTYKLYGGQVMLCDRLELVFDDCWSVRLSIILIYIFDILVAIIIVLIALLEMLM